MTTLNESVFDAAIAEIVNQSASTSVAVSHGAALRVWSWARVDGFAEALGVGHLANTGVITIEGDLRTGWRLLDLDGA